MSPMLLALVIGWAVVTVIVIAVSIVAIRSQRHGAEDEEVLIPWAEQQSVPSNQAVSTHPLDMNAEQLSAVAITGLQPVSKQAAPVSKADVINPTTSIVATAAALNFSTEAIGADSRASDIHVDKSQAVKSRADKKLGSSLQANKSIATDQANSQATDQAANQSHNKIDAEAVSEETAATTDLFISPETRFIRTLKQAIAPEMNIWRSLTHSDLNDSDNVVPIAQDSLGKTGLEHAPVLYSLHLNDSFKPLCLIHFEKKKSLSGKISGRKAIQRVRKLAATKKLPLVCVDESHQYAVSELQDMLAYHLPDRLLAERQQSGQMSKQIPSESQTKQHQLPAVQNEVEHHHAEAEKICPRCESSMSKKVATRGKYEGTRFWACDTYPKCRQVEIIHREYAKVQSSK